MPRSASTAWTRFFSPVLSRTRLARWRSNARRSLVAWGAIQASGNKSARSSWARVAASTLSFLSRAEAMALQRLGWTRCGSSSSSSNSSTSQPQP
jgi:hypothetical protein